MSKFFASLAIAAAAAITAMPASAEQFLDFQVNEASVPGSTLGSVITADKLNGGFTEYVTLTGPGTFSAQAYANFGQFFKNEGTQLVGSLLNANIVFAPQGYAMYALFNASGTVSGLNFTGTAAEFHLYIDPDQDTTFGTSNGVTPIATGNSGDDYEIAFSTTLGSGTGTLQSAPGAYNFDFTNFTLTADGKLFFISPNPFHMNVRVNGDNDQAVPLGAPFPLLVTGDVSAVFNVPEPGSLALVGLALTGLGVAARRRRA